MGGTSSVKDRLFGDTKPFQTLLLPIANDLVKKYKNKNLKPIFQSLPYRSITTGPMSMCYRLCKDLGMNASTPLLQAVGTVCLHISTHDDLIDETPVSQIDQAALLYAGNVSFIEGLLLLQKALPANKQKLMLEQVARNHELQQVCTETLWQTKPNRYSDYLVGVQHDGALVGIGVTAALSFCNKEALWPKIQNACHDYGTALQLLDDIAEVEEDRLSGYNSYPLTEGAPYKHSFSQIYKHLDKARSKINPEWTNFLELFTLTRTFAKEFQKANHAD